MTILKTTADLLARQRGGAGALETVIRASLPLAVRGQVRQHDHVTDIAVECEFRWNGLGVTILDLVNAGDGETASKIVREKLEALYADDPYIFQDNPDESELFAVFVARPKSPGRMGNDHELNARAEAHRGRNTTTGRREAYQVRHQLRAAGITVPMNKDRA